MLTGKDFLECSSYFSIMHQVILYIVEKFQLPNCNTFRNMNCFVRFLVKSRRTDRQTESDTYELTMQTAKVGLKTKPLPLHSMDIVLYFAFILVVLVKVCMKSPEDLSDH